MIVKKVLNNNIILAADEKKTEKMILGKGIGFNKKTGDNVNEEQIEKIFKLDTEDTANKLEELIGDVPANYLELTKLIIDNAERDLNCKFNDSIYIGLLSHINYSLTRFHQNNMIQNALLWEVKKFYPKEFMAAMESLTLIKHYENVELNEDEASFIAMHFVNGQQDGEAIRNTVMATKVIQDILSIIQFHFKIELDEKAVSFNRFIVHIRFFLQRIHQRNSDSSDSFLFDQVRGKYPDIYECSLRIKTYLENKFDSKLDCDEMMYFMLHIARLIQIDK